MYPYVKKLTEDQVREIKEALREGVAPVELAARYGVSANAIRTIKRGETWGWVK
jgi:uncharacterized protein YjcR